MQGYSVSILNCFGKQIFSIKQLTEVYLLTYHKFTNLKVYISVASNVFRV